MPINNPLLNNTQTSEMIYGCVETGVVKLVKSLAVSHLQYVCELSAISAHLGLFKPRWLRMVSLPPHILSKYHALWQSIWMK